MLRRITRSLCLFMHAVLGTPLSLFFFPFNGVTIQATLYSNNTALSLPSLLLFVIRTSVLLQLSTFGIGTSC